jgi:hypothetical protein
MQTNKLVIIIIFVTGIFSLFTMNGSHSWGDDFAMYLMHAENIANAETYNATGFIFNEMAPTYAPQSYPPGFPLLLAPVQPFFELNYAAYKVYILLFFMLYLWLAYLFLKNKLSDKYVIAIVFILAMSPFIWQLRDSILADIPGALFFLLSCMLFEKALKSNAISTWLLCGFVLYFAYVTRSTAIVLLPAFFMHVVIKKTGHLKQIGLITILFFAFNYLQSFIFVEESNYFTMLSSTLFNSPLSVTLNRVGTFIDWYFNAFSDLYIGNYHNIALNTIAFYLTFILFLAGFINRLIKSNSYVEWMFLFFLGLVVIWPGYQGLRYFTPVLIFYLFFAAKGLALIPNLRLATGVSIILMVSIIGSYGSFYFNANYGPDKYGLQSKNSIGLFDYIKNNTPQDGIIMSAKPRAIGLITDRGGIVFPDTSYSNQVGACIDSNNVSFVVLNNYPSFSQNGEEVIKSDTINYKKVYENGEWLVFEVIN